MSDNSNPSATMLTISTSYLSEVTASAVPTTPLHVVVNRNGIDQAYYCDEIQFKGVNAILINPIQLDMTSF